MVTDVSIHRLKLEEDSEGENMNELLETTEILSKPMSEGRSRLSRHPWISLALLVGLLVASVILSRLIEYGLNQMGIVTDLIAETMIGLVIGALVYFVLVPYGLGLPQRKTSVRKYLQVIGIRRPKSYRSALLLIVPCTLFLFLSWFLASVSYNYFVLGRSWSVFMSELFMISRALPPQNWAMITSIGVYVEEVMLRGILIKMLSERHSERTTIVLSAVAFGLIHLLNLLNGPPSIDVLIGISAQVTYTTIYGLFYGYLFIKTGNLIPNIVLHYIGDAFIGFFWYTPGISFLLFTALMLVFYIGPVPTILSILWVKFASDRWSANEM